MQIPGHRSHSLNRDQTPKVEIAGQKHKFPATELPYRGANVQPNVEDGVVEGHLLPTAEVMAGVVLLPGVEHHQNHRNDLRVQ